MSDTMKTNMEPMRSSLEIARDVPLTHMRTYMAQLNLTDDDFVRAEGSADKLMGIIQERFGDARDSIRRTLNRWL